MKSNNCKSRAYWDLLFANEISFSLKVSLTILTSERWKDELSSKWRHVVEWRWLFSQEHNTEIFSLVHGTCCYGRKVPESLSVSAECSLLLKYSKKEDGLPKPEEGSHSDSAHAEPNHTHFSQNSHTCVCLWTNEARNCKRDYAITQKPENTVSSKNNVNVARREDASRQLPGRVWRGIPARATT